MDRDIMTTEELLQELAAKESYLRELDAACKQLQDSERRCRNFIDNIDESCYEVDLNGRFTFANKQVIMRTEATRDSLMGHSFAERVPPGDVTKIEQAYADSYRTGEPVKNLIYRYFMKNGDMRLIEDSSFPMRDDAGRIIGFRGVARDVTDRQERIHELEGYKSFVDNVEDACFEVDLSGHPIFLNDVTCRLLEGSPEELRQGNLMQHLSPSTANRIRNIYRQILKTGETARFVEYDVVMKNGDTKYVQATVSLIRDTEGRPSGFRGVARDMTEQIKAEKELERYKNFVDSVDDPCVENDLNGRLIFFNDALRRNLGYSRAELMQIQWRNLVKPESVETVSQIYRSAYETGEPVRASYEIIRKDGQLRAIEIVIHVIKNDEGKPVGFRTINRDITESRKQEGALERYKTFFDHIEDGLFEIDLQGRFTLFNEATCRTLEYTPEELRALPLRARYADKQDADNIIKIYGDVYRTGVPIKAQEQKITAKSGKQLFFDISISLICDAAGNPTGFRCVSRDITERRRLEQEQTQLKERLVQMEKLESIGTLAGGIAHDFNNLLMGIQGYASLIMMDTKPHHRHYKMLKSIEEQVKSGADLTRQLLGYAQGGRYVIAATDMNDLMGKTVSLFARTKKEIRIHERYTPDLWTVQADQGQIEQVLFNLFVNAWQAMPGGGSLYLETSNVVLDDDYVKAFDCPPGPYIKMSVTDTGMGMDEKTRQRIFEPFFTTKEMSRGVGLGLASAYGIIRGHKGIINVYSELGRGTTFNIYLPAAEARSIRTSPPAPSSPISRGTIFIVDDEKTNRDVTAALLKRLGYEVMTAEGGREAVVMYANNQDRIDLIIMDMIMPDMGGGEAIDRIRELNPQARVILASGYSINGEAKDILERGGALEFIQKPFQIQELSEKIDRLIK
jgi:PAS domain S-box-containing protein